MREQEREVTGVAVLRPGGTHDSSPAIYRRVRYYTACVPEGRPNTLSCAKAEGPPLLN
jgi:hypothetical protein